jgi:hypothetical protein
VLRRKHGLGGGSMEQQYLTTGEAENDGVPASIIADMEKIRSYFGGMKRDFPGCICRMMISFPDPISVTLIVSSDGERTIKDDMEKILTERKILDGLMAPEVEAN